ncbi:MAG: endolytic transglycosylase MltG [Bacteroidales bacterium]
MRRRYIKIAILLVIPLVILVAIIRIPRERDSKQYTLYVYPQSDYKELLEELYHNSIIQNRTLFSLLAKHKKLPKTIKVGRYQLSSQMGNIEIIEHLRRGLQQPHNLVISGRINSMERLAATLSSKILYDSTEVLKVLKDSLFIDSLGFNSNTFLGMFLLESHQIYWTTTPKALVERLHKEYVKFWTPQREEQAKRINLSPIEVITIASIVAEESNKSFEHPIIAGLYLNRLKIGMPLQADPTIRYILRGEGVTRILYRHLKIDSPYNTYKYRGLPPGPIVAVSPQVIDATLNYTSHNYLFFCAKGELDGTHNFAETFSQHNRNVAAYRRAIKALNSAKSIERAAP